MKVGVDAKWILTGPPSGKRVVEELVRGLLARPGLEVFLFVRKAERRSVEDRFPGATCVGLPGVNNFLANLLLVPRLCRRLGLEACVMQNVTGRTRNCRSVVVIHDILFMTHPEHFTPIERLYYGLIPAAIRNADSVITVSNYQRDAILEACGLDGGKVGVAYNGTSSAFRPLADRAEAERTRADFGLAGEYMVFVGRQNRRKNIPLILEAMRITRNDLRLALVGPRGNAGAAIVQAAKTYGLEDRLVDLGPLGEDDLARVLRAAFLLVFPSRAEGFGLPIAEAMASGVPVVSADATAMPEICGDAAVLFRDDDAAALAAALDRMCEDGALRARCSKDGLALSRRYTWSGFVDAVVARLGERDDAG